MEQALITSIGVGILLLSLALFYDQIAKRIPTRLRVDQAPKSGYGLIPAVPYNLPVSANGTDIIFIHGLGSNPDTTWRARKLAETSTKATGPRTDGDQYVNWVSDFLLEDLLARTCNDTRIFFYNYDSYWKRDAVRTRLSVLGNELLEHVKSEIRQMEEEQSRNLIFVGYSYGGLVIKQAFVQARLCQDPDHIAEQTKGIVFLGTPHHGSNFTAVGRLAAQVLRPLGSNPSILAEVEYGSESLMDLQRAFEGSLHAAMRIVNFFEQRPTRILKFSFILWEDFCVTEQSATFGAGKFANIGLPVDHSGLNKFESRNSSYKRLRSKLIDFIKSPSQVIKYKRQWNSSAYNGPRTFRLRNNLTCESTDSDSSYYEDSSEDQQLDSDGDDDRVFRPETFSDGLDDFDSPNNSDDSNDPDDHYVPYDHDPNEYSHSSEDEHSREEEEDGHSEYDSHIHGVDDVSDDEVDRDDEDDEDDEW